MKIKILTWNTGLSEGSNAADVLDYIKSFLKEDNTIAVLQQIPYKDPDLDWIESSSYRKFVEAFPYSEYRVFNEWTTAIMYTVIVTKVTEDTKVMNVKKADSITTSNREAAVCINNSIVIYGLHAKNGKYNKSYLQSLNSVQADIFLGDFNAGDYEESENKSTFRGILKNHVCICNMPTKEIKSGETIIRRSCIDHVFVKRELVIRCSELIVHEDIKYSDHYPITFSIEDNV